MTSKPTKFQRMLAASGLLLAILAWCFAILSAFSVLGDVFVADPIERARIIAAVNFRFGIYCTLTILAFLGSVLIAAWAWRFSLWAPRATLGFHALAVVTLLALGWL